MKLLCVGGGKMGEALLGGLIETGWADASDLAVLEVDESRRAHLAQAYPGVVFVDEPAGADVLIAVKPDHVPLVAGGLRGTGVRRVLSIAAGITTASLESHLDPGVRVVRAMPNTPALVGEGAAAIAAGTTADDEDIEWARTILSAVGRVEVVAESQLDAVTGLSGSGPAYVFLIAEAMIAAGEQVGLERALAERLTKQTLLGAATLLTRSTESPEQLRANVTSPGGTTAEGLRVLDEREVREAFAAAIRAATERSIELGES